MQYMIVADTMEQGAMSGLMQAQQLIDRFAYTVGLPALAFDEDATLALQFENGLVVLLGVDASETWLTLLSSFAGSAGPKSAEFLESLLLANFLWTETGGATLGIDGHNGPLTLQKRYRISELTYPAFETELNGFLDSAFAWSRKGELGIVGTKAGDGTDAAQATTDLSGEDTSTRRGWLRA